MKKILTIFLLTGMTAMAVAQGFEFRMGEKTNKKAYQASMIQMAEGMQEGRLLVVEPELKAVSVGGIAPKSVKALRVRLCDMEWRDERSVTLPDTKRSHPYETFRVGSRLHTVVVGGDDKRLTVRHIALDAQSLEVTDDGLLVDESVTSDDYYVWAVSSPDGRYHGVVYAIWGKRDSRAVAMLFDGEMNKLWMKSLVYSDVSNVIVSNSGAIVTMGMGMVEDNKDITAFRVQLLGAEGERHGEYVLDADVSDVALLNTDGDRVLAVALEGKGGYGVLRFGALGNRRYTGLWGLVFDLDKGGAVMANRHPFTDEELLTLGNEDAGAKVTDRSIYFIRKVDDCTTPQGGAVLYQHAWKVETRDNRGVNVSETVHSQGILVVQADMKGGLTVNRLPQNNQNAGWPDVGADVFAHDNCVYVVTNESKDESDEYTPDHHAKRSKSLMLANTAVSVYWFTPDGQGAKKVVERERKALLKTPLFAGSNDRYYFLTTGGLYPHISMLKIPSGK